VERKARPLIFLFTIVFWTIAITSGRAVAACLSIAGSTASVTLGSTLTFTASCCAAVPALASHGWILGGALLVAGAIAIRRRRRIVSVLLGWALLSASAPVRAQSCGAPFQWKAQSANETFLGTGPSFSFAPTQVGTFTVSLNDTSETAAPVTVVVNPVPPCTMCEFLKTRAGVCANTSSTANAGTTVPSLFGCNGFTGVDKANCNSLITCLRSNNCATGDDPTPCLCGALSAVDCANQPVASLTGPCKNQYVAAANGGDVFELFFSTDSPIGVANALYACDIVACTGPPGNCLGAGP
jgi:hypothetical protein